MAGIWYVIFGMTGAYGLMIVPKQIIRQGDAIATMNNILSHEFLFRTGIVGLLLSGITFIIGASVLYKLLKHVNEHLARLMVAFVVVQAPIIFILETISITVLMLLKGNVLKGLEVEQMQNLVMIFLKAHEYGILLLEIFMGLWLLPFGLLIYKSGLIPRIIGVLLLIAGIAYAIDSLTFVLFPDGRVLTQPIAFTFSGLGEISIVLWLLIKGVKVPPEVSKASYT